MQHSTGVAVVATQLPGTDRRALSQAWYSALHLAERPRAAAHAPRARESLLGAPSGPRSATGANAAARDAANDTGRGAGRTARGATGRYDANAVDAERRIPKTELARQIERGLARRPARGAPASFAVRGAGGRVHLIVRNDGAHTRVVAVCAPPLRERVERALAQARFALAGRGVRAEVA
ncbi:MAG TPA: hypothetical protein VGC72_12255 [Candidatus Elarobacter sp.]|jgi:hypothetical protein